MSGHVHQVIAELHAARSALQGALIALDHARDRGEDLRAEHLRLMWAELHGAGEEAAVFLALLTGRGPR